VDDDAVKPPRPFGAYFLFVRWGQGDPVTVGHAETPYLAFAESAEQARDALGAMSLNAAKEQLDQAIDARTPPSRPWYDVMRAEGDDDDKDSNG
jgi:hypothetical protein